jgi:ribonuclease-3
MDPRLPFIHPSFALEQKLAEDNQRLEFLGDALLDFVIAEYLHSRYPLAKEGILTKLRASLVRKDALAELARQARLEEKILLGEGERRSGGAGKDSILADAFEAHLAWLFLEHGFRRARKFILECYKERFKALQDRPMEMDDPKSRLQEHCQLVSGEVPTYRAAGAAGPAHVREFRTEVWLGDRRLGEGTGRSKKASQQAAAENALLRLEIKSPPSPEGFEE